MLIGGSGRNRLFLGETYLPLRPSARGPIHANIRVSKASLARGGGRFNGNGGSRGFASRLRVVVA